MLASYHPAGSARGSRAGAVPARAPAASPPAAVLLLTRVAERLQLCSGAGARTARNLLEPAGSTYVVFCVLAAVLLAPGREKVFHGKNTLTKITEK